MTKEAKAQLEELEEETDSLITTQSKLRDLILNATKVESNAFKGFDIQNDDGSYKSTYEMLLGIAEIWEEIGKRDKATGNLNQNLLLETVAGKRRANIAASIFQNPDLLKSVLASSEGAEGSAQQELDKYLNSIEGKVKQFQNSVQEFAVDLVDNDTVKTFVDFGRQAIEVIDGIAKHIPLITTAIGGLITVITSKAGAQIFTFGTKDNGKFGMTGNIVESLKTRGVQWTGADAMAFSEFEKYANKKKISKNNINFANFIKMQENLSQNRRLQVSPYMKQTAESIKDMSAAYQQAEMSQESFSRQAVKSGAITKSLTATFKNLGASILSGLASFGVSTLVSFAVQGIIQLFDAIHESSEEIKEAGKAAQDEFDKIQDKVDNTRQSAEDLGEAYNRLSKGVDTRTNKNISLSTEEYEEYIDTVNKIVELSPSFKDGIDSQGNAIVTFSEYVGDATAALDEFIEREEHMAAIEKSKEAYDIVRGGVEEQKEYKERIEELERIRDRAYVGTKGERASDVMQRKLREFLEGESQTFEMTADEISTLGDSWQDYKKALQDYLFSNDIITNTQFDSDQLYRIEMQVMSPEVNIDSAIKGFSKVTNTIDDRVKYEADIAQDQIDSTMDEAKLKWESSLDAAMSWIEKNPQFREFPDEMQSAINNVLHESLNYKDFINESGMWEGYTYNEKEMESFVNDNVLYPISHAFGTAYEENHKDIAGSVQDLLEQLFTIDSSEITAKDYESKVSKIVGQLSEYGYLTEIDTTEYDFKVKYNLIPEITVDGHSESFNSYADAIDALLTDRGIKNKEGLNKYISSMTVQQQIEIFNKASNQKFTNAEVATAIVGAVEKGLEATTDYLGAYTTRKAKETAEAFTNAITAVSNEIGNISTGTIDEDFARFIGGYEDDIVSSMINIEENAQRAQKYFTEDGLGIYSFAADAIEALDSVAEHEKLISRGWNEDSKSHSDRLKEVLSDTGLVDDSQLNKTVYSAIIAYQDYIEVLEEAKEAGYEVAYGEQGQSIFGNVDLSDEERAIEWTNENLSKYKKTLESLDQDVNEIANSKSTALGGWGQYGKEGTKIAFSPVFYDPEKGGEPKLFTSAYMDEYITHIVEKLEKEGKTIDLKNVLTLDTKNLIADVGESSPETARKMHYAGVNGAVELARKQLLDIGNTIDEGYGEAFLQLMDETDESIIRISKHGTLSFKKTDRSIKKVAERMNMSNEQASLLLDSVNDLGKLNYDSVFFNDMQNQINNTTSDVNALTAALQEMGSQGYLSAQTMQDLIAANPQYGNLLIHSAGGTLLDANDVRHQIERDTIDRINEVNTLGIEYASKLESNRAEQIGILSERLGIADKEGKKLEDTLTEVLSKPEQYKDALEGTEFFNLEEDNQQLENYIYGLSLLRQELYGSISLMKEYKDALQTPNMSDNYNTIVSGLEGANKLAEQGWWGKDDFVTYANLLADYGESESQAVDNFIANRDRMQRYMTEDTSGLFNFATDALQKGLITRMINEETGEEIAGSFDFSKIDDIRDFADGMDMQVETAENFLLAIRDAGGKINLTGMVDNIHRNMESTYADFEKGKITIDEFTENWAELSKQQDFFVKNGIEASEGLEDVAYATANAMVQLDPAKTGESIKANGEQIGENLYQYEGLTYATNELGNATAVYTAKTVAAASVASGLNKVLATTKADSEEGTAAIDTYVAAVESLSEQEQISLGFKVDSGVTIKEQVEQQITKAGKVEIPAEIDPEQFEEVDMTVAISQDSIKGIRDAITEALSGIPLEPGEVDLDKAQQTLDNHQLYAKLVADSTAATSSTTNVTANFDMTNVSNGLDTIEHSSASPKIGLNVKEFATMLSNVNSSLNALSRSSATPRVLLDTSSFATAISNVVSSLNSLNGKETKVYIKTVKQTGKDTNGDGTIDVFEGAAAGTFFPQAGAYAGGTNVGIRRNERALVNEIGQESLVFISQEYMVTYI